MVYTINEQIPKNISTISTFRDLYLEVVHCLNVMNRSIYGLPAIVIFITGNVGIIIYLLFNEIIFTEKNDILKKIINITTIVIRTANIIFLYGIGHVTAKEVFILYFM